MSELPQRMLKCSVSFLAYAYRTLCLTFLVLSVLRFSVHDGGWFNFSVVFLILSCPFVLVLIFRLLRKGEGQAVTVDK